MYKLAKAGASFVPIAMPCNCVKMCSLNLNTLFLSTYFNRSKMNIFCGLPSSLFSTDVMAFSCDMLVYKLSMSNVIRWASLGTSNVSNMWIKSV